MLTPRIVSGPFGHRSRLKRSPRGGARACLLSAFALGFACQDPSFGSETSGGGSGAAHEDVNELLVLATTDTATGAIASLNLRTLDFAEHALGTPDARVQVEGERVYVLHRYMYDYLDIFEPSQGWARIAQIPLDRPGVVSTNPHSLARAHDGRLFISCYGTPELLIVDPEAPATEAIVGAVDLSEFADSDGTTEAPLVVNAGENLALFVQRLDRNAGNPWPQVAPNLLLRVDPQGESLVDLDPDTPGVQGVELPGEGLHQGRRDPADSDAIYLLTNGVLRVQLGEVSHAWAVTPESFVDAGIDDPLLPQAFDLSDDGSQIFIAAYDADFFGITVYQADLDLGDSPTLSPIISGVLATERSLEVVGDQIWLTDTTTGAEGLRAYTLSGSPIGERVPTGLPPYGLAAR